MGRCATPTLLGMLWTWAVAWAGDNGTNLVFVRIQKTGSKSLLNVLEQCEFTMCPKRPVDAVDSDACAKNVRVSMLKNMRSYDEFSCYVTSHCSLQTYGYVLNHTMPAPPPPTVTNKVSRRKQARTVQQQQQQLQQPRRMPSVVLLIRRNFVLTMLRDAVSRTVSEYRHVCAKGRGQWDYSTHAWRSQRAALVNESTRNQWFDKAMKPATKNSKKKKEKHSALVVDCETASALVSFAAEPQHANGMRNRQTRMLAGATMRVGVVDPRPDAELYTIAKRALDDVVDLALVFERFHLSLLVLAHKLGLAPPQHFSVIAEAIEKSPKPQLDGEAHAQLAELNKYDALLHSAALADLTQAAQRYGLSPEVQPYKCDKPRDGGQQDYAVLFSRQETSEHHYYEAARCHLDASAVGTSFTGISALVTERAHKQRVTCETRMLRLQQRAALANRTRAARGAFFNATAWRNKRMRVSADVARRFRRQRAEDERPAERSRPRAMLRGNRPAYYGGAAASSSSPAENGRYAPFHRGEGMVVSSRSSRVEGRRAPGSSRRPLLEPQHWRPRGWDFR